MVASFLLAIMLYSMPLPHLVEAGRPEWIALVLVYWAVALPDRVGVGVAWSVGLLMDVLLGTLLGKHALAMALLVFLAHRLYQRLRMFPALQQAFIIFILIGLDLLLLHWIDRLAGSAPVTMHFLVPAATSAFLWPAVYFVLHTVRLRFRTAS